MPLDWTNSTNPATIAVAVMRLSARVPVSDPRYAGPILINPGGPGGSGVAEVLYHGKAFQTVVDHGSAPSDNVTEAKYYDIVGWDPRSVGFTTPRLNCFPNNKIRRDWLLGSMNEGSIVDTDISFDLRFARWQSLAKTCMAKIESEGENSIAYHMGVRPVVEDMVAVVDAHSAWRRKELGLAPSDVKDKVLYWGVSFGTILGQALAALYPERMERIVLDGVAQMEGFFNGDWYPSIKDGDEAWQQFYKLCAEAGPEKCPFWAKGGKRYIERRYKQLLAQVKKDPVIVPGTLSTHPDIIKDSDLTFLPKEGVYCPIQLFPLVAGILDSASKGDGAPMSQLKLIPDFPLSEDCLANPYSDACEPLAGWRDETLPAVHCPDAPPAQDFTKEK